MSKPASIVGPSLRGEKSVYSFAYGRVPSRNKGVVFIISA